MTTSSDGATESSMSCRSIRSEHVFNRSCSADRLVQVDSTLGFSHSTKHVSRSSHCAQSEVRDWHRGMVEEFRFPRKTSRKPA